MGNRIKLLRESAGLSQDGFGKLFGVSRNAVSQWEKEDTTPEQKKLEAMAERYGVTLDWLSGKGPDELTVDIHNPDRANKSLAETSSGRVKLAVGEPDLSGPKNLKVLGFVKAGRIGFYPSNGETLEMTERPPMLLGVPDAYAVYIDDRSMFPALRPGYLMWVHPRRPPRTEDIVIVQVSEEEAYIKEFVRRTDKHIVCKQYNPPEELKYPVQAKIHVVVGGRFVG